MERNFKLNALWAHGQKRFFNSKKSPIKLPDADVDTEIFTLEETTLEFGESFFPNGVPDRNRNIIDEMLGKPQICLINCLCLVDLRKNPQSSSAYKLLQNIWTQHSDCLTEHLSLRWIMSTMQAVAFSTDDAIEQAICYAGITYGSLMKIYESERHFNGLGLVDRYLRPNKHKKKHHDKMGLGYISIVPQDIARNLNSDLYFLSGASEFSGKMLQELLERTSESENVFARLDRARRELETGEIDRRKFSFLNSAATDEIKVQAGEQDQLED